MVDPAEEACGLESEAAASCAVGGGLEAVCGLDATASGSYSTIFFSRNLQLAGLLGLISDDTSEPLDQNRLVP